MTLEAAERSSFLTTAIDSVRRAGQLQHVGDILRRLTFIFQRTADEFDDRGPGTAGRKEDEIMTGKLEFALHTKAGAWL